MEEVNKKFKKYNKIFILYNLSWSTITYISIFSISIEGYVKDFVVLLIFLFLIMIMICMLSLGFILNSFYQMMKIRYNLPIDDVKDLWAKTKTHTYNIINFFLSTILPYIIAYSSSFNLVIISLFLGLNIIIFTFLAKKSIQATFPNPLLQ